MNGMANGKELPYFNIGESVGGSQSWFMDPWMHIGGCGALTMCDLMIYMAAFGGRPECYSGDPAKLTRRAYRRFGMEMKPYLRPRETGIRDLKTFIDGAEKFLEYSEITGFEFKAFDGSRPFEEAANAVKDRIDNDIPVPMLMLNHQDPRFSFFVWHWFLITGYEESEDRFLIRAATYGKEHWLDFEAFWETGEQERGGLVLVTVS